MHHAWGIHSLQSGVNLNPWQVGLKFAFSGILVKFFLSKVGTKGKLLRHWLFFGETASHDPNVRLKMRRYSPTSGRGAGFCRRANGNNILPALNLRRSMRSAETQHCSAVKHYRQVNFEIITQESSSVGMPSLPAHGGGVSRLLWSKCLMKVTMLHPWSKRDPLTVWHESLIQKIQTSSVQDTVISALPVS